MAGGGVAQEEGGTIQKKKRSGQAVESTVESGSQPDRSKNFTPPTWSSWEKKNE